MKNIYMGQYRGGGGGPMSTLCPIRFEAARHMYVPTQPNMCVLELEYPAILFDDPHNIYDGEALVDSLAKSPTHTARAPGGTRPFTANDLRGVLFLPVEQTTSDQIIEYRTQWSIAPPSPSVVQWLFSAIPPRSSKNAAGAR